MLLRDLTMPIGLVSQLADVEVRETVQFQRMDRNLSSEYTSAPAVAYGLLEFNRVSPLCPPSSVEILSSKMLASAGAI